MSLKQELAKNNPSVSAISAIVGAREPQKQRETEEKQSPVSEVTKEPEQAASAVSVPEDAPKAPDPNFGFNIIGKKNKENRTVHKNFIVTPSGAQKFKALAEANGLSENELFNQICDKLCQI